MRKVVLIMMSILVVVANAADTFVTFKKNEAEFAVAKNGQVLSIVYDAQDYEGVHMAIESLKSDFKAVTGNVPQTGQATQEQCIIIGSLQSCFIQQMLKTGKLQKKEIEGKREKYLLQIVDKPLSGVSQALVIAGSDKRGTIYGIYELSRQMGVSPWYWWADVPARHQDNIYIKKGVGRLDFQEENLKLFKKYLNKTIETDYHVYIAEGNPMPIYTPFFFKDLDFDGVEELVIVHKSMAVKYHDGYDVYRIVDSSPVLIDYPPYNDNKELWGFGMTDYPEFDYKKKTISCPYPEGNMTYKGCFIYGVSKTRKDTVVVNGRYHYFNHMEVIEDIKYHTDE